MYASCKKRKRSGVSFVRQGVFYVRVVFDLTSPANIFLFVLPCFIRFAYDNDDKSIHVYAYEPYGDPLVGILEKIFVLACIHE